MLALRRTRIQNENDPKHARHPRSAAVSALASLFLQRPIMSKVRMKTRAMPTDMTYFVEQELVRCPRHRCHTRPYGQCTET
jgi:hypothetical protein